MEIEIEYTKEAIGNKDINDLFEFIEDLAKKTFEPYGLEVKHIALKTK